MDKNSLLKTLSGAGLSDSEARVYYAALSLGSASMLKIAKTAEIKRPTAYLIVESLKKKGLILTEIKDQKTKFVAEQPDAIHKVLEQRKNDLSKALPELSALYKLHGSESVVQYYEGMEGVKNAYESMITDVKPKQDYMVIGETSQWLRLDKEYFMNFVRKRAKLNIRIRLLLIDSPDSREHKKYEKNYNEKIKFLPTDTKLTTNLIIIPKKVLMQQLIPPVHAIIIENKSLVMTHQELFEMLWKTIK